MQNFIRIVFMKYLCLQRKRETHTKKKKKNAFIQDATGKLSKKFHNR